jgi:hypothetical protein
MLVITVALKSLEQKLMKVEYLAEGAGDCPLFRIYGSSTEEAQRFYELTSRLSDGSIDLTNIKSIEGFRLLSGSLLMRVGQDEGITAASTTSSDFVWSQKRATWEVISGLIEPFTKPLSGSFHQWLSGKEALPVLQRSKISLVFTNDESGRW